MAGKTGIWTQEEALEHHDFSYRLAKFIGSYFPKNQPLIDFGCGKGTYLRYFHDIGFENLNGIEGEYLPFFEFGNITVADLTNKLECAPIGNSISIEVGEHIPKEYEKTFLNNLVNNTKDRLILSWAIPGQDGVGHVNCQHNFYIMEEMDKLGMGILVGDTMEIRKHIDNNMSYLRNTLMVFKKR